MLLALSLAVLAAADPLGAWTANGARLELKDEGGKIVGRLAGEGGPCAVPQGTELLSGALLDDSISAQVRLCLVAPQCGSDPGTALAVLLVTKTLSGGVHTKAACAAGATALVMRRADTKPVAMAAPPKNVRLSQTPVPQTLRAPKRVATNDIAQTQKLVTPVIAETPVGQTPNRPVGPAEHPPGYDPRDARKAGTPEAEAEKMLVRGAGELNAGRFERAREWFRKALEKDPKRAEAYNGVGVTFYARGDLDEALAWYKRGLEANPAFGDSFYNMACVYALQKHKDLAFRYLRMAALNHYSEREQMLQDPDLQSLHDDPQWAEILDQMSQEAKPSHP